MENIDNNIYRNKQKQEPKMTDLICVIISVISFIAAVFIVLGPTNKQEYSYELTNSLMVNVDSHNDEVISDLIDINSKENGLVWITETTSLSESKKYTFMIKENENTVYDKTIISNDEIKYVKSDKNRITYIKQRSLLGFNQSFVNIVVEYDSSIFKL